MRNFEKAGVPARVDDNLVIGNRSDAGATNLAAVVVHETFVDRVIGDPFIARRTVAIVMDWPQWGMLWLVTAHLDSTTDRTA